MSAFSSALDRLFADPNIARDCDLRARGRRRRSRSASSPGGPTPSPSSAAARLWSETTRFDLRVAEVANPRPGDRIVIDGEAFVVQGEPVRDRERLVWTLDVRPA